jgi:hypothetical protein
VASFKTCSNDSIPENDKNLLCSPLLNSYMKREALYFHQDNTPTQTDHKQFPLMLYRLYDAHENCHNILTK